MKCIYCAKPINNKGSLAAHEQYCFYNPNKKKRQHSEKAGRSKGDKTAWHPNLKRGFKQYYKNKYPLVDILVENSTYARHSLKKRIIEEGIIVYKCHICNLPPLWNGEPMTLILDHINGINNDNRLINLRFVCSNCDSQLDTYKSRNRKGRVLELV